MEFEKKRRSNSGAIGAAYDHNSGTYGHQPPVFQLKAESTIQAKSPCDRTLDPPKNVKETDDVLDEMEERQKLVDAYSRQTIYELITLKSNDNKGSLDPVTQFIHTLYSPADEFDKGVETIENLPHLMESLDKAFKQGDADSSYHAAEELYEAYNNLPSKPGLPLPSKDDGIKDMYDKIKQIHELYKAAVVSGEIGNGVCDDQEQIATGIGRVEYYSWMKDEVKFISTKKHMMVGRYSDLPSDQWWQDEENNQWYIKANYLPHYEAIIESKK
jgi:hypothetical protein